MSQGLHGSPQAAATSWVAYRISARWPIEGPPRGGPRIYPRGRLRGRPARPPIGLEPMRGRASEV
eukprot:11791443-Alexandrium_andersonii.AAC.1